MRLDRSRPYAHVYENGRAVALAQDGVAYGHDDLPLESDPSPEPPTPSAPESDDGEVVEGSSSIKPDDMRLVQNKAIKLQWENYHEGEKFPGLAQAKKDLGIKD